jgi:ATP-dependent Zn protease
MCMKTKTRKGIPVFFVLAIGLQTPMHGSNSLYDAILRHATSLRNMSSSDLITTLSRLLVFIMSICSVYTFYKQSAGRNGLAFDLVKKGFTSDAFCDIVGNWEAKSVLKSVIQQIKDPQKYETMKVDPIRGVLLIGPPGTGKTALARAFANETGMHLLSTNGTSFDRIYVGTGAKNIEEMFTTARNLAGAWTIADIFKTAGNSKKGCVIFIDEADALLRGPGDKNYSNDAVIHTSLPAFLREMDGIETGKNKNIFVLAATNISEKYLDPAALRSGRFNRIVHIELPNKVARIEIAKARIGERQDVTPANAVQEKDWQIIGDITQGLNGADLREIGNSALRMAVEEDKTAVGAYELFVSTFNVVKQRRRRAAFENIATKDGLDEYINLISEFSTLESLARIHALHGQRSNVNELITNIDKTIKLGAKALEDVDAEYNDIAARQISYRVKKAFEFYG